MTDNEFLEWVQQNNNKVPAKQALEYITYGYTLPHEVSAQIPVESKQRLWDMVLKGYADWTNKWEFKVL